MSQIIFVFIADYQILVPRFVSLDLSSLCKCAHTLNLIKKKKNLLPPKYQSFSEMNLPHSDHYSKTPTSFF